MEEKLKESTCIPKAGSTPECTHTARSDRERLGLLGRGFVKAAKAYQLRTGGGLDLLGG